MAARHTPGVHARLKRASVGIAGVGGLGSAVAVALARVGVGRLVIADFDVVEPSNLNRQQYFIDQIGQLQGGGADGQSAAHQPLCNGGAALPEARSGEHSDHLRRRVRSWWRPLTGPT